jgi:hypothetical protein
MISPISSSPQAPVSSTGNQNTRTRLGGNPNSVQVKIANETLSSLIAANSGCKSCGGGSCSTCVSAVKNELIEIGKSDERVAARINQYMSKQSHTQKGHLGNHLTMIDPPLEDLLKIADTLKKQFPELAEVFDHLSENISIRIALRDSTSMQDLSSIALRAAKFGDAQLFQAVTTAQAEMMLQDIHHLPPDSQIVALDRLIDATPIEGVKEILRTAQDSWKISKVMSDPSMSNIEKLALLGELSLKSMPGQEVAAQSKATTVFLSSVEGQLAHLVSPDMTAQFMSSLIGDSKSLTTPGNFMKMLDRFTELASTHDAVANDPSGKLMEALFNLLPEAVDNAAKFDRRLQKVNADSEMIVKENNFNAKGTSQHHQFVYVTAESMSHFMAVYNDVVLGIKPESQSVTLPEASSPTPSLPTAFVSVISDSFAPAPSGNSAASGGTSPYSAPNSASSPSLPSSVSDSVPTNVSPSSTPMEITIGTVTVPTLDIQPAIHEAVFNVIAQSEAKPAAAQSHSITHEMVSVIHSVSVQAPALQAIAVHESIQALASTSPQLLPHLITSIHQQAPQLLPLATASLVQVAPHLPLPLLAQLPPAVSVSHSIATETLPSTQSGVASASTPTISQLPSSSTRISASAIPSSSTALSSPTLSAKSAVATLPQPVASVILPTLTAAPQLTIGILSVSTRLPNFPALATPLSASAPTLSVPIQLGIGNLLTVSSSQFTATRDVQRVVQQLTVISQQLNSPSLPPVFREIAGPIMSQLGSGISGNPAVLPKAVIQGLVSLSSIIESVSQLNQFPATQRAIEGVLTQISGMKLPTSQLSTLLSSVSQVSKSLVQLSQSSPLLMTGLSQVLTTLSTNPLPPAIMNTVLKNSAVIFTSLSSVSLSPTQQTQVSQLVQQFTQLPPKAMAEAFIQMASIARQLPQLSPPAQHVIMDILSQLPSSGAKSLSQLPMMLQSTARISISLGALLSSPPILTGFTTLLAGVSGRSFTPAQLGVVLNGMAHFGEALVGLPQNQQHIILTMFQSMLSTLNAKDFSLTIAAFSRLVATLNPAQLQLLVSFLELIPPKNQPMVLMQLAVISEKLGGDAAVKLIGILSQLMKDGHADAQKIMDAIHQFSDTHGISLSGGDMAEILNVATGKIVLSDVHGMDKEFSMLTELGLAAQAGAAEQEEKRRKISRSHEVNSRQLYGILKGKDPVVMAFMMLMGGVLKMQEEDFTGGLNAWQQVIDQGKRSRDHSYF